MQCTALRVGPARTPAREPHHSARVLDFDSLALCIPLWPYAVSWAPVAIHGSAGPYGSSQYKKTMVGLLSLIFPVAQCRLSGGACIRTVGAVRSGSLQSGRRLSCVWEGVRASELLAVQFKKLSQTVRLFIRECILYYGV